MTGFENTLTIPSSPQRDPAVRQNNPQRVAVNDLRAQVDWVAITKGIVAGDTVCFEVYYESYFPVMLHYAYVLSGRDEATCLDLVHDAMLKAIKSMKPMGTQPIVTAWTKAVVKSTVYDWLRKQTRQRKLQQQSYKDQQDRDRVDHRAHNCQIDDQARLAWIEDQLQKIDPKLRRMISMRYRLGWTLDRIARHFGLKTGAVDGCIGRAIDKLKTQATREFNE